jgi:hypothetical protein
MTRNIQTRFSDVQDEICLAFDNLMASGGLDKTDGMRGEWVRFNAMSTILKTVCRTSNRFFVNVPLCEYFTLSYG